MLRVEISEAAAPATKVAEKSRLFIINKLKETLPAARTEMSAYAPRMIVVTISPDKIKDVIGPGGKVINKIIADTGAKIDIENDGHVFISAPDGVAAEKAKAMVEALTKSVQIGETYLGTVTRLMNFGAFVAILPGKEGLFDPAVAVPLGAAYLRELLDRHAGQLPLTLAAYNAGPNPVARWQPSSSLDADVWIENIPYNETRGYVQHILEHIVAFAWARDAELPRLQTLLTPLGPPAP